MIRAHQPGSQPIDIPEVIPNPAVVPKQEPAPREPAPKEPVKVPEKVRARYQKGYRHARVADHRVSEGRFALRESLVAKGA
jgi:hypothetical protein